jgi:hypothetical protein
MLTKIICNITLKKLGTIQKMLVTSPKNVGNISKKILTKKCRKNVGNIFENC